MKRLVDALAEIVRQKVVTSVQGRGGDRLESRFIFHGPPLEFLSPVFDELSRDGGIRIALRDGEGHAVLPVLLQLPAELLDGAAPAIGASGRCSDTHLLHIRNDPRSPSFVALVPPGQHNNRSVSSTTEEFGIAPSNNTLHSNFDEWWRDGFTQDILVMGLEAASLGNELDDARQLVGQVAEAIDEMDPGKGSRNEVWRLLARIYSIPDGASGLTAGQAVALACGVPPTAPGGISYKLQLGILSQIAEEMSDGFRTGVERLENGAEEQDRRALRGFLQHVQDRCEVPTAFERATAAFYLPSGAPMLARPPGWWIHLTTECWAELLSENAGEEPDAGELVITCTNPIIQPTRGGPAVVRDAAELSISLTDWAGDEPVNATLTGGTFGKEGVHICVDGTTNVSDTPEGANKSPITYKVVSEAHKSATTKVISLAAWQPGIIVISRMASKLSPPKKPRRANTGADWESSFSLPGSGRYEVLLLVPRSTQIVSAEYVPDDATESGDRQPKSLEIREVRDGEYQVEIEADAKYQLNVEYRREGQRQTETCRIFITCEEAREEGCRSEFERSIKRNRHHLERSDTKSVIQLDRNTRASSLQAWLLEEQSVRTSFLPIVLSDDYGAAWAPPDWNAEGGPIISKARFLQDPRPAPSQFVPPPGFIDARTKIAARIRASTDDTLGLVESAPLGKWLARDDEFRGVVEAYLNSYTDWLGTYPDVACWVDAIAVCPREAGGRTLSRVPYAIILSPLHPLRLAWHCLAQKVLHDSLEGDDQAPCPAASILDPDRVPDILPMSLQAPGGTSGIDRHDFLSVECSSDYWSVLWNGARLGELPSRAQLAPFDSVFGLKIGGISSGFSPAQVGRALEDVTDILAAKPLISVVVASDGGSTDACNEGLASWCARRFGNGDRAAPREGIGPRLLEVYDTRKAHLRPDQATISNLSEDTHNLVRWFEKQPVGTRPDLGIIAQLDSAQPEATTVGTRSPLSIGGLLRHRVRRQLPNAFLSESRQARPRPPSGDTFADKVANCMLVLEGLSGTSAGLRFAPDVHAVSEMLGERNASFVAVSSSAIDPACFLGGWVKGTYLWDYDLPSYSQRAGDTNGYYLLSRIRESDRDALERVLKSLLGSKPLDQGQLDDTLLEVARRGIPTVRGISGDDTGATGDLGLFLAVRLLQDEFRLTGNPGSLLPVMCDTAEGVSMALVIPVDPFRGYLADLARSLGHERKDYSLSRPDLLVVGIRANESEVLIQLTPVEVKCRQGSIFGSNDAREALGQAKALSSLFLSMQERGARSVAWKLAFQHLLLSMVGFGLRVYSQHQLVAQNPAQWAAYHERIAAAILGAEPSSIIVDDKGRLVVIDGTPDSGPRDHDGDGFSETMVISVPDSGQMVSGDALVFYGRVRSKVGDWRLMPESPTTSSHQTRKHDGNQGDSNPDEAVIGPTNDYATGAQTSHIIEAPASETQATIGTGEEAIEPPNSACTGIVLTVGNTVGGFEPRQLSLNISDTRLNQLNIGVVGDLGTGKTQLLKSLILQITRAKEANRSVKPRFLIFDYKRDYSSDEFVAATGAKVVRPRHLPLNLFDTKTIGDSLAPWLDRFRFFADVLDKVYSGIGPVQRDKLKAAVRSAYENRQAEGRDPTIYDIHQEYRDQLGGRSDSPMAIIDDLVDMEIFEPDPHKTHGFNEFLDGVVVVSLDAMGQDDRSKNMLVAIMLNMFYENMLKTPKRPFVGTDPQLRVIDSYLLVDEADNIMRYEFDVLRKLLLQGREFGAGVILASQYLRHFKASATDYREPLLTWFIHKVPSVAPAELGALGFTAELGDLSERVKTLPNHHCLYKSFDVSGEVIRGKPFYELVAERKSDT